MKKIVIYPFSSKSIPLLLYLEKFNSDYSIGSIVSPPGLGMYGKDAGVATSRSTLGFKVEENYTNNYFAGECGVYLYILLQAIRQDYFIGCSLYSKMTQEQLQVISNEFNSRYGMDINCLHVSNKALDVQQTMQIKKGQYIYA